MRLERGLVQVYTGDGKGKTSAGVGQAVRSLGAGLRVAFVQFVKGGPESSELQPLRDLGAAVTRPAEVTTGLLEDGLRDDEKGIALEAWAVARDAITSGDVDVVVCDELNVAIAYDLVPLDDVLDALAHRAQHTEVVITGRGAAPGLREVADYVSEIVAEKHPFEQGITARAGIEY